MFQDRNDAGIQLAEKLRKYAAEDVVLLAIPRGGVVVAAEIARALNLTVDLIIPRKIGAPENEELAIGAVAGSEVVINEELTKSLNISQKYIEEAANKQVKEIERRRRLYLGDSPEINLSGKIAVVVDDGLATGATARAAIKAIKAKKPRKIVLAVPVAPREAVELISREVDELICLQIPPFFYAVGQFYFQFDQVTDTEVINILSRFKKTA